MAVLQYMAEFLEELPIETRTDLSQLMRCTFELNFFLLRVCCVVILGLNFSFTFSFFSHVHVIPRMKPFPLVQTNSCKDAGTATTVTERARATGVAAAKFSCWRGRAGQVRSLLPQESKLFLNKKHDDLTLFFFPPFQSSMGSAGCLRVS